MTLVCSFSESINLIVSVVYQHANEDVEKMILGNKCDMEDKRQVSKDRGDAVSTKLTLQCLQKPTEEIQYVGKMSA